MATKRIVPRATGEGGIGRPDKLMGPSYFSELGLSSKVRKQEVTVTTVSATPTVIWSRTMEEGEMVHVVAQLLSWKQDFSGGGAYNRNALARRAVGASGVIVGSKTMTTDTESPASMNVTWGMSANTLQLLVTGIAATTVNWRALVTTVSS